MLSFIGCALLLHAAYSSYEHHHLLNSTAGLSHDIILELVVGLLALNFGTIQSLKNKPRLSVLTGEKIAPQNPYLEPIERAEGVLATNDLGVSEYERLESRLEFMDIRAIRKGYMEYKSRS